MLFRSPLTSSPEGQNGAPSCLRSLEPLSWVRTEAGGRESPSQASSAPRQDERDRRATFTGTLTATVGQAPKRVPHVRKGCLRGSYLLLSFLHAAALLLCSTAPSQPGAKGLRKLSPPGCPSQKRQEPGTPAESSPVREELFS